MSGATAPEFVVAVMAGALGGLLATLAGIRAAPPRLERINVSGRRVPAVGGLGIVVGVVTGVLAVMVVFSVERPPSRTFEIAAALFGITGVMFAAGLFDDRRGDEQARGFAGHFKAMRAGALTGGLVKIVAGGVAGLIAAVVADGLVAGVVIFGLVPLTANLFNLLDRAPGRAAKSGWIFLLPLVVFGDAAWSLASAGLIGGLVAVTPFDLRERVMLGDAGVNPLGAVVGLGLGLSLPSPLGIGAVVAVGGLNLASERVSFSRVIESTSWLRGLDGIGRK